MTKPPLSELADSERCRFVPTDPDSPQDLAAAARIFEQCRESYRWTGKEEDPVEIARGFLGREAPPGGDPACTRTFLVRRVTGGGLVGLLLIHCGYPRPESLTVGSLFLVAACRRQGFGREILLHLGKLAAERGYRELVADVALENTPPQHLAEALGFRRVQEHIHKGKTLGVRIAKRLDERVFEDPGSGRAGG